MKITVEKIKRKLKQDYGWLNIDSGNFNDSLITELIKDTRDVIDDELKRLKGISIK